MQRFVALAVYGCTVAGTPTDDVDVQVRLVDAASVEDATQVLRAEPTHEYRNEEQEVVAWPLAVLLDVQALNEDVSSGTEVAGAITSLAEIGRHLPGATV